MAVLHIAMFRWRAGTTRAQVAAFEHDLARMPALIGGVHSYRFGVDLGLREGNFDFGVVAELSAPDDVARYLDHPEHLKLVQDHVVDMVEVRRAVQISI